MKFTEDMLRCFARPLSETETEKCQNAIREIKKALRGLDYIDETEDITELFPDTYAYSASMRNSDHTEKVTIFIQGSYANNTCVRGESDVDIAIVREDISEYTFEYERRICSGSSKIIAAKEFKNAVLRVLRMYFPGAVERKNKSILVRGNTYRKQTDTVPCVSTRHSTNNQKSYGNEGIVIHADNGEVIYNFPKQHIKNGKEKNTRTNHYYKKMVRIIKKMRYLMSDLHYSSADEVSSFGLESLLWNIPDEFFTKYISYRYIFDDIVKHLYEDMHNFPRYKEANGIKPLCPTQYAVDKYVAFVRDLYSFYKYEI